MTTLRSRLEALDRLPMMRATAFGAAIGVFCGAAVVYAAPSPWAELIFALLLFVGAAFAATGEAVAVPLKDTETPPEIPERTFLVKTATVPAGAFLMGSPDEEDGRYDNEGPVHRVSVSTFECMTTPVTRRLYFEITETDPSWPEDGQVDDRPVNQVSWFDAIAFCNRLSEKDDLTPCYRIQDDEVFWDRAADGYRLPTEAEWEYACRAGSDKRWSFGDDESKLDEYAWFGGNSGHRPHPVGGKKPNSFGLFDLHGNVYEWCWDWFGSYSPAEQQDPDGPESGGIRVLRGGSFLDGPGFLRSAFRDWFRPGNANGDNGFRCVRGARLQR